MMEQCSILPDYLEKEMDKYYGKNSIKTEKPMESTFDCVYAEAIKMKVCLSTQKWTNQ